ncbi:hypothetical protein HMPREF1487_08317 [Pseudomonas sp. HPB0071]|uniref:Uncharacterized protein n=1 Tax=Pseudomonas luteola TaxID=47886 RepID=A0A2X2DBW7_PSELU|nr:hypothetical protein HMPREF1487_08981 [Pseudomonas sp. HPB0071]ENA29324.1 hypothetical protein HMPREF1487_08317 [Pseudomonas sp. HPB0071]SPZ16894.1 Uncharacterised protein [Pseudomonas luteola]SPZ16913.1 Uncharacterised protein [Pseudomonas luteola]
MDNPIVLWLCAIWMGLCIVKAHDQVQEPDPVIALEQQY